MNINKTNIICILLAIILLISCNGCSESTGKFVINSDEIGFHLEDLIDKDQEFVLTALYNADADPQFYNEMDYLGSKVQSYVMLESKQGLEFEVSLVFINYPDSNEFVFAGYRESFSLDHWPDGSEQESLQTILDAMITQYGEPWQKNGFFDGNVLFDKYKISRYAEWEDGLIGYSLDYDMDTKNTIIWVHNYNSKFYNDHYEDEAGMKRPYHKENG